MQGDLNPARASLVPVKQTGMGFEMAGLSLQQAADAAGTSKSSIFRALKSGRISGTRTDLGGWSIEPAELFRVFPAVPVERAETRAVEQTVTGLSDIRNRRDLRHRTAISAACDELG